MTGSQEEHAEFHYATDGDWDREGAREIGHANPECAWILTDRDVWHRNPAYVGPAVPHPEADEQECYERPDQTCFDRPFLHHDEWDMPF